MLMVAKGHYSIDVVSFLSILIYLIVNRIAKIIAYFVTTRLWYILHSIINTRQLQTRTSANFLSRSAHCSVLSSSRSISSFLLLQALVVETDSLVRGECQGPRTL